jgi:hypothetical protein
MYPLIRNIHLFSGLFCGAFLLMYAVSAVQMAHNQWFNLRPTVKEERFAITASGARPIARELMNRYELRGEIAAVRETPGGVAFRIQRPGTVYEVEALPGEARVRTSTANFIGMLNRIHHVAGVRHEYWLINVWGWLVAVVSIGLFVLGASGIYLWFHIKRERSIGLALLVLGLGFSLPVIVLLRSRF